MDKIKKRLYRHTKVMFLFLAVSFILTLLVMALAITVGSSQISLPSIWGAIRSRFFPLMYPVRDEVSYNIVWELRLPRILLAVLSGAGLSISGVVMQALTRNPLVSPFTVGISNAAAFGASVVIMSGVRFSGSGQAAITIGAFSLAALCAVLVYAIASKRGLNAVTIVLAGTALTYLFSALTNTAQYIANVEKLEAIVHWSFGSFSAASYTQVITLFAVLLFCLPFFVCKAWTFDVLASGDDDTARGLGVDVKRSRIVTGFMAVLITALVVSFCGVIGFIGIAGPHIARMSVGAEHKFLLPFAAVFGGLLVLAADTAGRTLFAPIIVPVGIVVAYIGVPIFLQLILAKQEAYFK